MTTELDHLLRERRWQPYWGWHDDHRLHDRTIAYAPAMQQNRDEFCEFVALLTERGLRGTCLQLGLGAPGASHVVMQKVFGRAWTIEIDHQKIKDYRDRVGNIDGIIIGDTRAPDIFDQLRFVGICDLDCVFVDADHTLAGVEHDFFKYGPLVRSGGVIAMHDALKRPTYEDEIQVWRFVEQQRASGREVRVIGEELGIAVVNVP